MFEYEQFVNCRKMMEYEKTRNSEEIIIIPQGVYNDLSNLYNIMAQMQENKATRKSLEAKKEELENKIQEVIDSRKDEISKRDTLVNQKSQIFDITLQNGQDIDEKIKKIDEQISSLDISISSHETEIVEKKKELIQVRSDLVLQKEKEVEQNLKEKYQATKESLKQKSDKVIETPYTEFETADKKKANQMVQESMVRYGVYGVHDINEIEDFNSTSVTARGFQEQAKYERKAANYAQEVLQHISNGTLSMKDFGEQMHKYDEAFNLLFFINHVYNERMFQHNYLIGREGSEYLNKFATILENDLISKDYDEIHKLLGSVDKNLDGKISPEMFDKSIDEFDKYASYTYMDVPKTNLVSRLLHGKNGANGYLFYDNRFTSLEMLRFELPKAKLPVVQKNNQKFRQSLKVLENEKVGAITIDEDKSKTQKQEKEDSFER